MDSYQYRVLSRTIEEGRRLTFEATLSDLELAVTFLDMAGVTRDTTTNARCHQNALKAYLKTRRRPPRALTREEAGRLEQLQESIRPRLADFYGWADGNPPSGEESDEVIAPGSAPG